MGEYAEKPVAVVDIGSNSVRLVVYHRHDRALQIIFNEKSLCGLGRGVSLTGLLPEDGLTQARESLRRFRLLCDFMKVDQPFIIATAAARRATNGADFIHEVETLFGTKVSMLSGAEEAHFSAMGAVAGFHKIDGLVCDLGGGSLEMIRIAGGVPQSGVSVELGGLALQDLSGRNLKKANKIVNETLENIDALREMRGGNLIAIGGTWRAIARLYMEKKAYPLHVLHGFCVPAKEMIDFCKEIQTQKVETLLGIEEIARERRPLLPYGALVLAEMLARSDVEYFVVSTSGVREGMLYAALSEVEQQKDPLKIGASNLNIALARNPEHAQDLIRWSDNFAALCLPGESDDAKRLRHVACYLSEIAWRANPDYRAEEAARMVAYSGLSALTHKERALLAAMLYVRYEGAGEQLEKQGKVPLSSLLNPQDWQQAKVVGCLLRMGFTLSAGQGGLLPQLSFGREKDAFGSEKDGFCLFLPNSLADLVGERLKGRLKPLAKLLGRNFLIKLSF